MKTFFNLLILFICISCTEPFDWEFYRNNKYLIKKTEYNKAFIELFGTFGVLSIDSTHTWGFEPLTTRSINPNSNEWYIVPEDITKAEIDTVYSWFSTHKNPQSISIDWSDFFVQLIYGNNSHMNKLVVSKDGVNELDHIYNFNASGGSIQLAHNSTTNYFGFHNSLDSKDYYHNFRIVYINNAFYVGFDFESNGQDNSLIVESDGYFNDWIVKISPCLPKEGQRIMAEDLGEIGDFDFNDVVFDCYIEYNEWWHGNDFGLIILRAAGGTMPLYILGREVHEAFKVNLSSMVNTGEMERPIVIWTFSPKSPYVKDIEIKVENTIENITYYIDADQGEAPGKLCVPTYVEWPKEKQNIKYKYPRFPLWVEDKHIIFY